LDFGFIDEFNKYQVILFNRIINQIQTMFNENQLETQYTIYGLEIIKESLVFYHHEKNLLIEIRLILDLIKLFQQFVYLLKKDFKDKRVIDNLILFLKVFYNFIVD